MKKSLLHTNRFVCVVVRIEYMPTTGQAERRIAGKEKIVQLP